MARPSGLGKCDFISYPQTTCLMEERLDVHVQSRSSAKRRRIEEDTVADVNYFSVGHDIIGHMQIRDSSTWDYVHQGSVIESSEIPITYYSIDTNPNSYGLTNSSWMFKTQHERCISTVVVDNNRTELICYGMVS